ncbi:hypothetical protein ACI2L1_07170 [Streptomyces sp. NPDC019531]|uniref:hypothetical protein n=1 Tax=Streptomyces sp. NPDC019531 TaxID=3365062 RepID=UPI00384DF919
MRTHDGLSVSYRHPATGPAGVAVPHYVARAQHLLTSVTTAGHWPLTSQSPQVSDRRSGRR